MTPAAITLLITILLVGVVLDYVPSRVRRGIFFGVTTGGEFPHSEGGRATIRHYRFWIWSGTVFAAMLALFGQIGLSVFVQLAGFLAGWVLTWKRVRPLAIQPGTTRAAPLSPPEGMPAWGFAIVVISVLILGSAAVALQMNYELLPDQYPVHWGASGAADRFAPKTFRSVFGALVIGSGVLVLLTLTAFAIAYGSRRGGSPENEPSRSSFRSVMLRLPLLLMLVLSVQIVLIALTPLLRPDTFRIPGGPLYIIGSLVVILGGVVWVIHKWSELPGSSGDDTPDECWHWGMFYYNPQDPAVMVERRDGMGYTLNFAQPLSWIGIVAVASIVATTMWLGKG